MTPSEYMRSFISKSWVEDETTEASSRHLAGNEMTPPPLENEDNQDISPKEAASAVKSEGVVLLSDMHSSAMGFPPRFDKCLNHQEMNRIPSLYCYDHSRVVVSEKYGKGSYYHASFVDGYHKKNAYIFAQAPFDDATEHVFWRMVADQKPSMILVFGGIDPRQCRKARLQIEQRNFEKTILLEFGAKRLEECERKARICRMFWPGKGDRRYGKLVVKTMEERGEAHMKTFGIGIGGDETILMHFHEWGDDELPEYMLDMRASIKVQYIRSQKKATSGKGPVMLVCATGVSKCAFYATIDIVASRMTEEHTVGFKETMAAILSQRYGSFRSPTPYMNAREMLMKFAVSTGVVHDAAIGDKPKTIKSRRKRKKKTLIGKKEETKKQ